MQSELNGVTIVFSGVLDEKSSMASVRGLVEKAMANSSDGFVRLDFGNVRRANSIGILAWAKFVDSTAFRFVYVNAPNWLVEQFNLCGLLKADGKVESFQAPFYNSDNDKHEVVTLLVGKDVPIQDDYSSFEIVLAAADGTKLEADFEPAEYLSFLTRMR
jgi:hypothetical protein